MTSPAEKAAQTRRYNKAWTAHQERIVPTEEVFRKVLDARCPERDAKLEQARLRFDLECQEIVAEFEKLIEPDVKIREAAYEKSYQIFHQEAYPDAFRYIS